MLTKKPQARLLNVLLAAIVKKRLLTVAYDAWLANVCVIKRGCCLRG